MLSEPESLRFVSQPIAPIILQEKEEGSLDLFFPLSPSPAQVELTYNNSQGEHKLTVESDPFEALNRGTHQFNHTFDRWLLKPLAKTYQRLAPRPVRRGIRNFFSNLGDVQVTLNDLLQLKFKQAANDMGRLAINSTIGLGGLIDVAGPTLGLEKHRQNFGLTLAHYGVGSGPYLVLPLLGPSTVRGAFGLGIDSLSDPIMEVDHVATRNIVFGAEAVDFRASVLNFDGLIIGDEYLFIRGAYLQRLDYEVNGGFLKMAFENF